MRSRLSRHLDFLIDTDVRPARRAQPKGASIELARAEIAPEFNWRDYAIMLLHAAAEIEHSLMVEYLFAAYSLGGPQVPQRLEDEVRRWQEIILGIAKEEMGHLVTVQNVLISLGAPINLNRQEYPWGSEFYPFVFSLQRLSLNSLAKYVLAESPPNWNEPPLSDEVKRRAHSSAREAVNHVGVLYATLSSVLRNKEIPDAAFQPQSLPLQASWDTWGRGYKRGERGQEAGNIPDQFAPELVILRSISRDTSVFALEQISEQGEGPSSPRGRRTAPNTTEDSHFVRFKRIYEQLRRLPNKDQHHISRDVADNPTTQKPWDDEKSRPAPDQPRTHYIISEVARSWAHFFNLRYRMLMVNLAHSMHPIAPRSDQIPVVDRGIVVNRTFTEMYNVRVLAGILLELPLDSADPDGPRAGPPFEMPYTLEMPGRESNRWRLQLDLLQAARRASDELMPHATARQARYLVALNATDQAAVDRIELMLAGQAVMTLDEVPG